MEKWLSNLAAQSIGLHPLAARPQYFDTILRWLHDEWCATNASLRNLSASERANALTERESKLRAHLRCDQIPISFIAEVKQRAAVGVVSLTRMEAIDKQLNIAWLTNLFVIPGYRNRGVATGLVKQCENAAEGLQIDKLRLLTPQAEEYYAKRGWALQCRVQRGGQRYALMEKNVKS